MGKYVYKRGEYVEDSTKGRAISRPRRYKGDGLVQAWIDKRKLAMLSEWLESSGTRTRYLSDVLKFTIDIVVEQLVDKGVIDKVEFTKDAEQILEMRYRAELNPGGRGLRNRVHNLQLDGMRQSNVFKCELERGISDGNEYVSRREEADKLARICEERHEQKMKEDMERQKKVAMKRHRLMEEEKKKKKDTTPSNKPLTPEMVEDNMKRALEEDRKISEDPMMPPEDVSKVVEVEGESKGSEKGNEWWRK